jgi:hypothetical protein
MFVITADQVNSRNAPDLVGHALRSLDDRFGDRLALPPDRNAGDELQAITHDSATALGIVLMLDRAGTWSTGVGVGSVREPVPDNVRAASGPAFFAARDAVDAAKKTIPRFALRSGSDANEAQASDLEALIDLLLSMRSRRSEAGWELYDLLEQDLTQREAAERLGISAPAVSSRARAAALKIEDAAVPALSRLLRDLDRQSNEGVSA